MSRLLTATAFLAMMIVGEPLGLVVAESLNQVQVVEVNSEPYEGGYPDIIKYATLSEALVTQGPPRTSMHTSLLLIFTLLTLTLLSPRTITPRSGPDWRSHCLTSSEAVTLVAELESFCVNIDHALATQVLTPDFQQHSYSTLRPGQIPVSGTSAHEGG
jgi:hypothetical protein